MRIRCRSPPSHHQSSLGVDATPILSIHLEVYLMSHVTVSLPSFEERLASLGIEDKARYSINEVTVISGASNPMNTRRLVKNGGIPATKGSVGDTNTPKWFIARDDVAFRYAECRDKLAERVATWNAPVLKKQASRSKTPSVFEKAMLIDGEAAQIAFLKAELDRIMATSK